jgi:hypothetical protein
MQDLAQWRARSTPRLARLYVGCINAGERRQTVGTWPDRETCSVR